jgi:hypothetical protein
MSGLIRQVLVRRLATGWIPRAERGHAIFSARQSAKPRLQLLIHVAVEMAKRSGRGEIFLGRSSRYLDGRGQ